MPNTANGPNGQAINVLDGTALRRRLHSRGPKARARLAAWLINNNVAFVDLSQAQVARLVRANPGAVSAALGHSGVRGPRQSTIDRIIDRYGADTLLRALDRTTASRRPTLVAAE
jgi:hypothetical protein